MPDYARNSVLSREQWSFPGARFQGRITDRWYERKLRVPSHPPLSPGDITWGATIRLIRAALVKSTDHGHFVRWSEEDRHIS